MIEREMGNRGSKSVIRESITVKEQRVYGSWFSLYTITENPICVKAGNLRYTLTGFERNYQVRIPSKQLRWFSTINSKAFNPWFWTGLIDE